MPSITCPNCGKEAAQIVSTKEVSDLVETATSEIRVSLANAQAQLASQAKTIEDLEANLKTATAPPAPVISLEEALALVKPAEPATAA